MMEGVRELCPRGKTKKTAAARLLPLPAVIFKPQLKEVKYDESMTPQQWFQDWEHMFLVAFEGNPVSERYKMACSLALAL